MKPYFDKDCKCYDIEDKINEEFPNSSWNLDNACKAWRERSGDLEDNNIDFEEGSDEYYGCTCPTCGRIICGWCV